MVGRGGVFVTRVGKCFGGGGGERFFFGMVLWASFLRSGVIIFFCVWGEEIGWVNSITVAGVFFFFWGGGGGKGESTFKLTQPKNTTLMLHQHKKVQGGGVVCFCW